MALEVPAFRNLFHCVVFCFLPVEDLPDSAEASEAYLIVELVKSQLFLFFFGRMLRLTIPHAKLNGTIALSACNGSGHGDSRADLVLFEGRSLELGRRIIMVVASSFF